MQRRISPEESRAFAFLSLFRFRKLSDRAIALVGLEDVPAVEDSGVAGLAEVGFKPLAVFAMFVFACIDSIMASRQLVGLRDRVEAFERDPDTIRDPENGDRAQYQLYEIAYASGESAGVGGKEGAARWRRGPMCWKASLPRLIIRSNW